MTVTDDSMYLPQAMHLAACSTLLLRYHNNPHIRRFLTRVAKEKLLGATSASDPATGERGILILVIRVWLV